MYLVHSPEEYAALKADIAARRQVLAPVVRDQNGHTIDGFAREAIAKELGIKEVPVKIIAVKGEVERRHLALLLNCNRRQLSTSQKRNLIEAELARNPKIPSRQLARLIGVSPQTIVNAKHRLGVHDGRDEDVAEKKKATVFCVNNRQVEEAEKALKMMGDDAPPHPMTSRGAGHKARKLRIAEHRNRPVPARAAKLGVHHTDFRKLDVADGSVRLVLADPPYDHQSLPLYGDLAEWAKKKLGDDGILVAYASVTYLDKVFAALSPLNYLTVIAMVHGGQSNPSWHRNSGNGWKALCVFGKVTRLPVMVNGVYHSPGPEKELFEWQQTIEEVEYLVGKFSGPGDLIVSPFLGSGTDALAVKKVGSRRFLGCDVDKGMVNLTLERLASS